MTQSNKNPVGRVFFWIFVALIFIYLMFPFYWAIVSALKTESELFQTPATLWPSNPTLINFQAILGNPNFLRGLTNSLIVAGCTTLLALLVGSFAGYALGKLRFRGKDVSLYVILAMTMFPQIAILSGLYAVIRFLSLPTIFSLILTYLLFSLPFTAWVLTAFFRTLPLSLLEAARVDGASMMQTFWQVLLPLTAPALVTTGLLAFIGAWNEYLFALTFTAFDRPSQTVPVAIAQLSGRIARQEPFGEIMAAAVLVSIPLVILVLIFQARIVDGLTAGAVKG